MTAGGGVGIDALKVMDEVVRHLDRTMPTPLQRHGESHLCCEHHSGLRFDLLTSRNAIAELLAADREYDEARTLWLNYSREDHDALLVQLDNARARRASALAALEESNGR